MFHREPNYYQNSGNIKDLNTPIIFIANIFWVPGNNLSMYTLINLFLELWYEY